MKIKNQENDYCIDSRKGGNVIAYTSMGLSIVLCK